MNKKLGVKGGRTAFLLLWGVSMLLLTFQLWIPEFYHSFKGSYAVKLVLAAEAATVIGFLALGGVKRDFLGTFHSFLCRHRLDTPQGSVLFTGALMLVCGAIGLAGNASIDDTVNWLAMGRRIFLVLSVLYLMGRGLPDRAQLEHCLPWRLAQTALLCLLSKLLFGGFAASFYSAAFHGLADLLGLFSIAAQKSSRGLWLRTLTGCTLPLLLCIGVTIGYKAVFAPEVLDWQRRMVLGTAPHCYSLGSFAEALRESGSRGYLSLSLYVLITVCTVGVLLVPLRGCLNRLQADATALLGLAFLFMVTCVLPQYILNAELIARLLPFATSDCVLLTVFLGNSILITCEKETENESD